MDDKFVGVFIGILLLVGGLVMWEGYRTHSWITFIVGCFCASAGVANFIYGVFIR